MSVLAPAYRLRVYAPRSFDATELTLLTPAPAAPHAEAFRVASISGVPGYRPYLFPPEGRRGSFDLLTKRVDAGEMTFAVFDRRTAAGENARRWLTAFAGDAEGKPILLNCRVEADESLDGGATWAAFFAGRVQDFVFDEVQVGKLTVRDESSQLDEMIFVGRPHASIAYGRSQSVLPVQPPPAPGQAYRSFEGTVTHTVGAFWFITPAASASRLNGNVVSKAMTGLAVYAEENQGRGFQCRFGSLGYAGAPTGANELVRGSKLRALVTWSGGSGEFPIWEIYASRREDDEHFRPHIIYLGTYPVGSLGYAARPAASTVVKVTIVADASASEPAPIVLEGVNPLTAWQDVLAGKFSRLNDDGTVRRTMPVDTTAFTALAATREFLPLNAVITKPISKREFIEKYLLRPYHLGYRLAPNAATTPFDCRRDSTLAAAPALGLTDLAAPSEGFSWRQQRSDAVSIIRVEAFRDRVRTTEDLLRSGSPGVLNAVAGTLNPSPLTIIDGDLSPRALDVTGDELVIDAPGWRSRETGTGSASDAGGSTLLKAEEAIIAASMALASQLRSLFGPGSTGLTRAFRRRTAGGVYPGMWRRLTIPEAPNAASYQRGGERLGFCVDRIERGPLVELSFIDGGASSVAVVPVLAAPAMTAEGVPTVSVTVNAAADPVLVQVAVTTQAVGTLPTAGWQDAGIVKVTGTLTMPTPPAGLRLWVRARSEPQSAGDDFKLPSAFVSPSPAFIDTGTVAAPTGVGVSVIGRSTATVTWTVGDATLSVEVLLVLGSFSAGVFDGPGLVIARLPAGSTSYRLGGLDGPSVAHCVGVRHRNASTGRTSVIATANFSTSTTDPQLARPAGLCIVAPIT